MPADRKELPDTTQAGQAALRQAGLRVTHQRMLVLEKLRLVPHVSAEDLHRTLQDEGMGINLPTLYRVLSDLEEVGLVEKHSFHPQHAVYELSTRAHHDHLICLDCGRIVEFMDAVIEERQEEVGRVHSLKITNHAMYLYGHCTRKNCDELKKAGSTEGTPAS